MGTATPVSLHVRPYQAAHLCFEVDGILEISNAQLGAAATAFDFPAFYAILGAMPTVSGDASRLEYDFPAIDAAVSSFALAALRKEPRKAALNSAINTRQNAYFAKYANAPAIIAMMNNYYSPSVADSKPNRLAVLSALANDQFNELKTAYTADGRLGVVKNTGSVLNSTTESTDQSAGSTSQRTQERGSTDEEGLTATVGQPTKLTGCGRRRIHGGCRFLGRRRCGHVRTGGHKRRSSTSTGGDSSSGSGYASETDNRQHRLRVPGPVPRERSAVRASPDQPHGPAIRAVHVRPESAQPRHRVRQRADQHRRQHLPASGLLPEHHPDVPDRRTITGIYKNPGEAVRAASPSFALRTTARSICWPP